MLSAHQEITVDLVAIEEVVTAEVVIAEEMTVAEEIAETSVLVVTTTAQDQRINNLI